MPQYDLVEGALRSYRCTAEAPADLDAFWAGTLGEPLRARASPRLEPVQTGLALVSTWDVTLSGFGGDPVRAWFHRPAHAADDLPVVVRFPGYGEGRGAPHDVSPWVLAGYASLAVDTRDQGWGDGNHALLTRGILRPDSYYYRRVYVDAVLAVEAATELPGVDGSRVAAAGISQGGGIALAAAALSPRVGAVMADVPLLCDFRRGAAIAAASPYTELARYLAAHPDRVAQAFATLAYFDVALLAGRASAPALFSVGLMDEVCPPSTVFAAFNAYAGPKRICTYPFGGHEGGGARQRAEQLRWLPSLWA